MYHRGSRGSSHESCVIQTTKGLFLHLRLVTTPSPTRLPSKDGWSHHTDPVLLLFHYPSDPIRPTPVGPVSPTTYPLPLGILQHLFPDEVSLRFGLGVPFSTPVFSLKGWVRSWGVKGIESPPTPRRTSESSCRRRGPLSAVCVDNTPRPLSVLSSSSGTSSSDLRGEGPRRVPIFSGPRGPPTLVFSLTSHGPQGVGVRDVLPPLERRWSRVGTRPLARCVVVVCSEVCHEHTVVKTSTPPLQTPKLPCRQTFLLVVLPYPFLYGGVPSTCRRTRGSVSVRPSRVVRCKECTTSLHRAVPSLPT